MKALINRVRQFARVEDGLVTVEWVALTAGMVVAAVAIGYIVMTNTGDEANGVGNGITSNISATFGTTACEFASKIGQGSCP